MAVPLLDEPADAAGLIEELRGARGRPEAALRRAAPFAAAMVPTVIDLVDRAADGVYLTPHQSNLLFWGVHVLGAGRRSELCAPLLRMLRDIDGDSLEDVFGDATTASFAAVFVSIYDGKADALIAAIIDQKVDSYARWALFNALTRLTFDGAVSRELTFDFLDRFERERPAPPLDPVWEGWVEAVVYLRVEHLHDRLRNAYGSGLFDDTLSELKDWERDIAVVDAMRPDDPGLLNRERLGPITDINQVLSWIPTDDDLTKRDAGGRDGDPAFRILPSYEQRWLRGFLLSKHVPDTSMTVEQLDGYFTALAVFPDETEPDKYMPALWNYDAETEAAPNYDSAEQAEYVGGLLARYREAVGRRIAAGYPHPRTYRDDGDEKKEGSWAVGVIRGVALDAKAWASRAAIDDDCAAVTSFAYALIAGFPDEEGHKPMRRERTRFFRILPRLLLNTYRGWRGLLPIEPTAAALAQESEERLTDYESAPVRAGPKIGRNQPCPCGSGKKYKRCCGGIDAAG